MKIGSEQSYERVLRLAADCNPTSLHLSPTEGYLLSRIDGHTTWDDLRRMGALPADAVDACVTEWLKESIIEFGAEAATDEGTAASATEETAKEASSESTDREKLDATRVIPSGAIEDLPGVDESLDLSVEQQEEFLEFAKGLGRPYHEILGTPVDADTREIKKAYFQLSKRFHPDRYFRRNTGPFGDLIEVCFKRLLEAYELLSDPVTRVEVQKTQTAAPAATKGSGKKPLSAVAARRRLRERVGQLSGHKRHVQDHKRKAKSFFESGMTSFREERWLEAAGSVRLAIAFDPENQAYRESFAGVQRKAHEERSAALMKQANGAFEMRHLAEAYELFDEAIHYRPFDAELAHRTAQLAWTVGEDLKRAKELAQQAVDLEPESAEYHGTLGQIFVEAEMIANAKREFEAVLRIDPKDKEAKAALRRL